MAITLPLGIRVAAGLVGTAIDRLSTLPGELPSLAVTFAGQALRTSMRVQQEVAELATRGDDLLSPLTGRFQEHPPWATFDEDEDGGMPARGATDAATAGASWSTDPVDEFDIGVAEGEAIDLEMDDLAEDDLLAVGDLLAADDLAVGDLLAADDLAVGDLLAADDLAVETLAVGDLAVGDLVILDPDVIDAEVLDLDVVDSLSADVDGLDAAVAMLEGAPVVAMLDATPGIGSSFAEPGSIGFDVLDATAVVSDGRVPSATFVVGSNTAPEAAPGDGFPGGEGLTVASATTAAAAGVVEPTREHEMPPETRSASNKGTATPAANARRTTNRPRARNTIKSDHRLTIAELKERMQDMDVAQIGALLAQEEAGPNRAAYLTLLSNRLTTLQHE